MTGDEFYVELGLMVGLELHQQLDTPRKLFCHCPTVVRDEEPDGGFLRRLRPTQSEMGAIDPAALFEFQRKKKFYYEYYNDTTCLVEADEEPPHNLCEDAIDICLTMANFLESSPIEEIHPMRKIVIDGSNTTGFQRTCIVATGGHITVDGKEIGIQTICLEEDAARKIKDDEKRNMRIYRLDRLGIPLIEVATSPDIRTPDEAQNVALELGLLLRSTGKVKRGQGTIRQDVNVSIRDGAIIEIKGLQQLDMLSTVVELEANRQHRLLEIKDELQGRGVSAGDVKGELVDVSEVFKNTTSKLIKRVLKSNGSVYATKLEGFTGLLSRELQPERRLGTELSDYAKFWGGVGGIFHTDELPGYGITDDEVTALRNIVEAGDKDAVVIVASKKESCIDALEAVVKRARLAAEGIPAETRTPLPNGTSKYARPRPGAERMYPETDVRPVQVSLSRLRRIAKEMPETLESRQKRFVKELGLSEDLATQIVRSLNVDLFEHIVRGVEVNPTLVAVTLENTVVSLHRDGVPTESLSDEHYVQLFQAISEEKVTAEAIPDLLTYLAKNPSTDFDEAVSETGLETVDTDDVEGIIKQIVSERSDYIKEQGERSIGGLMGVAMKELRGKVDGKTVKRMLTAEVEKLLYEA